ncbi:hypothetical protein [Okeania sp. SIO2B9]|uniref:hypothetical protein n=1 Tax=Okeania sp. SIO2B9 TaxID=2607782 RepID=UPI002580174D|nr:hypothetical protein [Okeania sp. SIO2B9]
MPFAQAFRRNHIRLLALLPLLQFVNIPALIAINNGGVLRSQPTPPPSPSQEGKSPPQEGRKKKEEEELELKEKVFDHALIRT